MHADERRAHQSLRHRGWSADLDLMARLPKSCTVLTPAVSVLTTEQKNTGYTSPASRLTHARTSPGDDVKRRETTDSVVAPHTQCDFRFGLFFRFSFVPVLQYW